jgi:hypothetical protein
MRYVSFTFDDGSITGAKKVAEILKPYKATFYIVTGWVLPNKQPVLDRFNKNVDHGSIKDWIELSVLGHDIGSHTATHVKGNDLNIEKECHISLDFLRHIHLGPYSISSPHHSFIKTDIYDSVRVGTYETIYKKVVFDRIYNKLENINLKEIYSCDEQYSVLSQIINLINDDNIWLVLSYHSLDGEGFCPITSKELDQLKDLFLRSNYEIKSVKEMILLCDQKRHI